MIDIKAADILALSHAMLSLVKSEEWDKFSELQLQQMQLMTTFFEHLNNELLVSERDALEQVRTINEGLIGLAEKNKVALGQELLALKQNTEKVKAYRK